jgi:isoquinoline 1-oxidoreductase alpha subunit
MAVIALTINNRSVQLDLDPDTPLLWALRDHLNLVGTKFGCGGGFCGACTVHLDGVATRSCSTAVSAAAGRRITTIEGLSTQPGVGSRESGVAPIHPVQQAWLEIDVPQCGYCQAGQIMSAAALLARTPNPSDDEITAAMNGNICRCGTYIRIRQAVRRASELAVATRGQEQK